MRRTPIWDIPQPVVQIAPVMNDIPYGVLFWGTNRFHRENLERFPIVIARKRIPQPANPFKIFATFVPELPFDLAQSEPPT